MYMTSLINLVLCNSRCTSIAWVPGSDGTFVVAHADGNLYVYEKASLNFIQCAYSWPAFTVIFCSIAQAKSSVTSIFILE